MSCKVHQSGSLMARSAEEFKPQNNLSNTVQALDIATGVAAMLNQHQRTTLGPRWSIMDIRVHETRVISLARPTTNPRMKSFNPERSRLELDTSDRCLFVTACFILLSLLLFTHGCARLRLIAVQLSRLNSIRKVDALIHQSQWGKICTGDFHDSQKDVPISNLERPEDPSSRRREIFGITSRWTKLEKAHIHQAKTTWNSKQDVLAARQQVAAVDRK